MKPYIYLRSLRQADHTVFCVQDGQKTYYDPQFGTRMPYSSGQQVKRSILDELIEHIPNEQRAPITFNYELKSEKGKDNLSQKEPWSPCDPLHVDQLVGGWMRAQSDALTLKRRSPLSISAMRPLHPTLARTESESLTFDRSEAPDHHPVKVRNAKGEELSLDEINEFLHTNKRALPRRHWIPEDKVGPRASGLFVYDVAVDLRRLFSVSLNQHEPELTPETIETLKSEGWQTSADGLNLLVPKERRDEIIPALATALINWRITSNQARTYSPQATLAVAISDNANRLSGAIRADLVEAETERMKAEPVIDALDGVNLFTALPAKGYIPGVAASADALDKAEEYLREQLSAFNYEA